ncbi:MAG: hypothetical protein GXY77_15745 [Fibrobacter sp.]|nr:hypothetical protein [Fibrobacter sp.]
MIPRVVHFIFGLSPDFGKRSFSYINYLSVITAWKQLKPDNIYFHYEFEPQGQWWDKAKKYVVLNKIISPDTVFGNPIISYQHKADVLRLEILKEYGGIYLDIDVISLNPFDSLLSYKNVMGVEPSVGLCNAVILAEKNSKFIESWYMSYKSFKREIWNYHSIQMPLKIANSMEKEIRIENYYSFYYPFYKDTAHYHLWGVRPDAREILIAAMKNLILKLYTTLPGSNKKYYPILHQFKSQQWHFEQMNQSYCIHLWETLWWSKYLSKIQPDFILDDNRSVFCSLIRNRLTDDEISGNV